MAKTKTKKNYERIGITITKKNLEYYDTAWGFTSRKINNALDFARANEKAFKKFQSKKNEELA